MTTAPRKTAGALAFERQMDARFPHRIRPDGWLGDSVHRRRKSSHNPDDTPGSRPEWDGDGDGISEVRALDLGTDLGDPNVTSRDLVEHLVDLPNLGLVIRYIIHQGKKWHVENGFRPVDYDGDDQHFGHIHITFAFTQSADNNTTFDYQLEEIGMALTDADRQFIIDTVTAATTAVLTEGTAREIGKTAGTKMPLTMLTQYGVIHAARADENAAATLNATK